MTKTTTTSLEGKVHSRLGQLLRLSRMQRSSRMMIPASMALEPPVASISVLPPQVTMQGP